MNVSREMAALASKYGLLPQERAYQDIAAALREAVERDRDQRTAQDLYRHSYEAGWQDCREAAAKIVESEHSAEDCDCAVRIYALSPSGEKEDGKC